MLKSIIRISIMSDTMRIPDISTIKKMRKQIGVNQTKLAKEARVSQSLIARIESGKVDPTYSKTRDIFVALEKIGKGKILTAKDVLNRKIMSIKPNTSLREAATLMRRKGISQIPVIDNGVIIGSLSEEAIIDSVAHGKSVEDISLIPVKDIMSDAFPLIDESAPISMISLLLEYNSALLVSRKGRPIGIITKADLLKLM